MAEATTEFTVDGVESEDDVEAIERELEDLEGVMGTVVDQDGSAEIHYDVDLLSDERIKITVAEAGYDVEGLSFDDGGGDVNVEESEDEVA